MKTIAIIIAVILLVAVGPLLTIWALNTLFPVLAIEYNLATWAAVIIVHSILQIRNR